MKALVIYYSQSGNTQYIAKRIAAGLDSNGCEATLSYLNDTAPSTLDKYDLIGIGSPVWYEMPPNVRRFIEELPDQKGKLCFSFCTHGTLPDLYFPLAVPRLQRAGFTVIDWKSWYGDIAIQVFPEPYYTHGHPDEQDLREAENFGNALFEKAQDYLKGNMKIPHAPQPYMSTVHANAAIDHLGGFHNGHGKLLRDSNKCLYPKCRICMDNCTMGYIDLNTKPQCFGDQGNACDMRQACTYCEMLCPVGAIYPEIPYEIKAPVGQHHGSKLFSGTLRKAEEEGKFRRLIPESEVGVKTPYYSVHKKHPRLKPLKK